MRFLSIVCICLAAVACDPDPIQRATNTDGGQDGMGGAGGDVSTGGMMATGGQPSTGGTPAAGGTPAVGGTPAAGGTPAVGGTPAAGGAPAAGGTPETGGMPADGGASDTGTPDPNCARAWGCALQRCASQPDGEVGGCLSACEDGLSEAESESYRALLLCAAQERNGETCTNPESDFEALQMCVNEFCPDVLAACLNGEEWPSME